MVSENITLGPRIISVHLPCAPFTVPLASLEGSALLGFYPTTKDSFSPPVFLSILTSPSNPWICHFWGCGCAEEQKHWRAYREWGEIASFVFSGSTAPLTEERGRAVSPLHLPHSRAPHLMALPLCKSHNPKNVRPRSWKGLPE